MTRRIPRVVAIASLTGAILLLPGRALPQKTYRHTPEETYGSGQQIDSDHSFAKISLASSSEPKKGFTFAIARVSGRMTVDQKQPANSVLNVSLYPADQGRRLLKSDGSFGDVTAGDLASYTLFSFQSKTAAALPDGRMEFSGTLTMTYVEREENMQWSIAYSGPDYGPPKATVITREVKFVTDPPSSRGWPEHSLAVSSSAPQFSALAALSLEDTPKLREMLLGSNWPPVVLDEKCETPRATWRDYRGVVCTGVPIETSHPEETAEWNVAYSGPQPASAPTGDRLEIELHLILLSSRNAAGLTASP
jgi:polyisoprenoid-binding protein YceI